MPDWASSECYSKSTGYSKLLLSMNVNRLGKNGPGLTQPLTESLLGLASAFYSFLYYKIDFAKKKNYVQTV